jgi:hypothetical protein
MTLRVPPTGPIGSHRPDPRIVHRCNRNLDPICGSPYRESGGSSWIFVNCPECLALADGTPQVERLQEMLRGWPA